MAQQLLVDQQLRLTVAVVINIVGMAVGADNAAGCPTRGGPCKRQLAVAAGTAGGDQEPGLRVKPDAAHELANAGTVRGYRRRT